MSDNEKKEASLFSSLLERINVTLEQIGSLGNSGVDEGQLWAVDHADEDSAGPPRRIGSVADLAWPVAGGNRVFAIQQGRLVEMTSGEPQEMGDADVHWLKLVGALPDGTVGGIVLDSSGNPQRAVLGNDGSLETESQSEAGEVQMAFLMQESRSYTQERELKVDRPESRQGFDVFYKSGRGVQNVSDCRGDACGHPSLSSDGKLIVFIRQPRY